jgi:hypothetical protein
MFSSDYEKQIDRLEAQNSWLGKRLREIDNEAYEYADQVEVLRSALERLLRVAVVDLQHTRPDVIEQASMALAAIPSK